ncbi:hypothetical protein [Anaerosalibacter bizertensis]|nr:hypothetical protein [Anaerosalibacter bizertensis]
MIHIYEEVNEIYGYGKKAYFSAILDLYDNNIVAYVVRHRNK